MSVLRHIFIYPIKSTAPVALDTAVVTPRGIEHDRRYVITDHKGRFITARRFPRLVLVQAAVLEDGIAVTAPGMSELTLRPQEFAPHYTDISVWKDTIEAQHCPGEADEWFSEYLGTPVQLHYMGPHSHRPARGGGEVSFADASPLLLLSQASLAGLNDKFDTPMDVRRFRPNLVVDGLGAHEEDDLDEFTIGEAALRTMWPCARCILTTIDPDTAEKHPQREPLATLMRYRESDGEAMFGVNVGVTSAGAIRTGDRLVAVQ